MTLGVENSGSASFAYDALKCDVRASAGDRMTVTRVNTGQHGLVFSYYDDYKPEQFADDGGPVPSSIAPGDRVGIPLLLGVFEDVEALHGSANVEFFIGHHVVSQTTVVF
jgi:hypothetical protein